MNFNDQWSNFNMIENERFPRLHTELKRKVAGSIPDEVNF
jgi:hypothetical protein